MPSPFPGMDPYLEHPELWTEVHSRLLVNLADYLGPQLRPKYRVAVEKRTYVSRPDTALVGIPDVAILSTKTSTPSSTKTATLTQPQIIKVKLPMPEEVRETYLEIREIGIEVVITVIELLSPKNKRVGVGRETYEKKRMEVLGSSTHLIEIDLLRAGKPMFIVSERPTPDYSILVSRSHQRPLGDLYPFSIRDKIPAFPLPLRSDEAEPTIDLQELLNQVYEKASFDLAIDYTQAPIPALKAEDRVWAEMLLHKSFRPSPEAARK